MQRVPGFLPIYSTLINEKHRVIKNKKIKGYNFNFRVLYLNKLNLQFGNSIEKHNHDVSLLKIFSRHCLP